MLTKHFLEYKILIVKAYSACPLKKVEIFQLPRRTKATRADIHILRNINYVHMYFLSARSVRSKRSYWKTALKKTYRRICIFKISHTKHLRHKFCPLFSNILYYFYYFYLIMIKIQCITLLEITKKN